MRVLAWSVFFYTRILTYFIVDERTLLAIEEVHFTTFATIDVVMYTFGSSIGVKDLPLFFSSICR